MKQILGKVLAKLLIKDAEPCFIISRKPIILISYWSDYYHNHQKIFSLLPKNQKIYFIFQLGFHVETKWRMDEINSEIEEVKQNIPAENIEYLFLCNSDTETGMLKKHKLNAVFCNQNSFLDKNNYKIIENEEKIFDAVYLARITPIKRHELASEVESLKLIGSYKDSEVDYFKKSRKILSYADWTRKVYAFNIYKHLNQAKVGLCLSAEEGAMFVSAEYLLCGLPVVSTESIGGRDTLFDDEYVSIVEDTSNAVAEGIKKMIDKKIDPNLIRDKTIKKMELHQEIFINIIQEIYNKENADRSFRDEWSRIFVHKIGLRTNLPFNILRKRILRKNSLT